MIFISVDSLTLHSRLARVEDISDFLSVWLEYKLLESSHQEIFDEYYKSYRRFFGERMRAAYSEQIKEALEIVEGQPGIRVLEVGFGLGTESLWLAMRGAKVVAIDISAHLIEAATRRKTILEQEIGSPLECEFRRVSVLDLEEEENFDLIWAEQAFHHLEPREAVVDKIVS